MSKTPKGKQSNTLFAYFKKTPKQENSNEVLSPRRSPNSDKKIGIETPGSDKSKKNAKAKANGTREKHSSAILLGDVVWAKLEGFPWWPSLVCNHPTKKVHFKGGKTPEIHVQFFDDPPSRAWIKEKYIKPFLGTSDAAFQKGGKFFTFNNKIQKGALDADKALLLETDERLKLVVELQPSSDEEKEESEEEVVEKMDFDPSIFDDEMSEVEKEKSKENCNNEIKDKEENTVLKSPIKNKKSPISNSTLTMSKRKAAKEAAIKNKRRKIIGSSSAEESEDDFKPASSSDEDDEDVSSGEDEAEESLGEEESESESPVKPSRKRKSNNNPSTKSKARKVLDLSAATDKKSPTISETTKSKLSMFSSSEAVVGEDASQRDISSFHHLHLDFLQPDKIKDADKKLKSDPDYNPKTLHVPESFLNKQTPAMRQWWELKTHHFDTVLFFKVGKFYELYHMDAVTGVNELGLIYMKGEWAHSGFPEIAYNRYADALIQKGFKVARVEQTETPEMMSERCKNMGRASSKFDKVVKREICQISTQGTKTYSFLDGDTGDASNKYILAVCEKTDNKEGMSIYGVCFIDTFIGTFHLGQFTDDRHLSRMRTLLAHYTPTQVLYERGRISPQTLQLFNANLTSALKEALSPGTEFWESGKTLKTLAEEDYFKQDGGDVKLPEVIKSMLSENDALGLTASESSDLAIRALGAITWYLQYCLLDQELLSMRKFEEYKPKDIEDVQTYKQSTFDTKLRHMVLDGVTMANLDVIWNSTTQSLQGTLLERLNTCATPFGKRLFHQWLCAPLCQPSAIYDRLDAVDDLMHLPGVTEECVSMMKKLPDLEKLLSSIPWKILLDPSIQLANDGFNISQELALLLKDVKFFDDNELKKIFMTNGVMKGVNETVKWPSLGSTLQTIADEPESLYSGQLMTEFVAAVNAQGSSITVDDLRNYTVLEPEVLKTKFKELTMISLPPPSGGPLVALILKMAEKLGWKANQANTSLTYHQLIEIYKFVYAHQSLLGDPELNSQMLNTTKELLSEDFVAQLVSKINDSTTFNDSSHYGPFQPGQSAGTSHLSIIDSSELMVSITLSLNYFFGNKITVGNLGILLNNQLLDFDVNHATMANSFANGKRPQSYMSPTVLFNDDHPCDKRLILGGAGGKKITTSLSESIINSVIFQQNLSSAICSPRVHNELSQVTWYEDGISDVIIKELVSKNHELQRFQMKEPAAVNGIEKTNDAILAYADYRKFGGVAVY